MKTMAVRFSVSFTIFITRIAGVKSEFAIYRIYSLTAKSEAREWAGR